MRRWLLSCAVSLVCINVSVTAGAANEWLPSLAPIDGGNVRVMGISAGTLYAGTWGDGIFVSTDEGGTWHAAGLPDEFLVSLEVIEGGDGAVYAGTLTGLYRTDGPGSPWHMQDVHGVMRACASDPVDPVVAYVGVDGLGVLRTDDDGADWTAVGALPRDALV